MILVGDVRDFLPAVGPHVEALPPGTVQCAVTSPPYFGLRDYGVDGQIGHEPSPDCLGWATGERCGTCFVCAMVQVFRGVWRAMRDDGVLWLNLGDSYTSGNRGYRAPDKKNPARAMNVRPDTPEGLKPKDLIGIPWRVAFALQADGWILRQDVIWAKPNPMPESVKDRCTKSHEYLFMLTKSERYHFDAEAIKEKAETAGKPMKMADGWDTGQGGHGAFHRSGRQKGANTGALSPAFRNKRSVWEVATQPFKEAHYATFPPKLIEPCILAASRPGDLVLDPFMGAGTTAIVADSLGRRWIGCELNPDSVEIAQRRIVATQPGLCL